MSALPKVNLFLVGGAKCGTTTLAQWLGNQGGICLSRPKEPWFFSHGLRSLRERAKSMAWYQGCYAHYRGERYLADGSTSYLYDQSSIARILRYNPDAKFIVALRDPVDVARSLHKQMLYNGQESVLNFEQAWRLCTARREGRCLPVKCENPRFLLYDEWCAFGSQVRSLLAQAPEENVCFVFFDEIVEWPDRVRKRLEKFLDLPLDNTLGMIHANRQGFPMRWTVRVDDIFGALSSWRVKPFGFLRRKMRLPWDSGKGVGWDASLRRELEEFFAEEVRLLAQALPDMDWLPEWLR